MELTIQNIGRFHNAASIEVNGITVLAGINGTGKSTIGKSLYCVFNSLYEYRRQIIDEKIMSLVRILRLIDHGRVGASNIKKRLGGLLELAPSELTDEKILNELWIITGSKEVEIESDLVERVKSVLRLSDDVILNAIMKKRIVAEFDSQAGHTNYPGERSHISIKIKDKTIKLDIDEEGIVSVSDVIELSKDLVYVDDPFVIDDLSSFAATDVYSHKTDLMKKILNRDSSRLSAVDDLIVGEKLKSLYEKIESVCGGQIEQKEDEFGYRDNKLKKRISIKNLSTGMKSFVIIKTLLSKGYLEENGIVVLDEPEAHLHPEWMILYAEIVTLLQKELGINFVISTHSSEFISYLELFIKQYELGDRSKFYLLEENTDDPAVTDVKDYTGSLDKIYDVLTRPFIWASKELDSVL